jgi:hypothetical protein
VLIIFKMKMYNNACVTHEQTICIFRVLCQGKECIEHYDNRSNGNDSNCDPSY